MIQINWNHLLIPICTTVKDKSRKSTIRHNSITEMGQIYLDLPSVKVVPFRQQNLPQIRNVTDLEDPCPGMIHRFGARELMFPDVSKSCTSFIRESEAREAPRDEGGEASGNSGSMAFSWVQPLIRFANLEGCWESSITFLHRRRTHRFENLIFSQIIIEQWILECKYHLNVSTYHFDFKHWDLRKLSDKIVLHCQPSYKMPMSVYDIGMDQNLPIDRLGPIGPRGFGE